QRKESCVRRSPRISHAACCAASRRAGDTGRCPRRETGLFDLVAVSMTFPVTELRALSRTSVETCVARYGARLVLVPDGEPIPHSHWGAPEAGLEGDRIYARADTPVHSLLHELCHYVCMTPARRARLVRDAGGTTDEECAV